MRATIKTAFLSVAVAILGSCEALLALLGIQVVLSGTVAVEESIAGNPVYVGLVAEIPAAGQQLVWEQGPEQVGSG